MTLKPLIMENPPSFTFPELLAGVRKKRLDAEQIVAAILPLIDQVLESHERGLVAPLSGIGSIQVTEGRLGYRPVEAHCPSFQQAALDRIDTFLKLPFDVAQFTQGNQNGLVLDLNSPVRLPSYIAGYTTWEQRVGHHDPVTDVFAIGMILASLALGLDFRDRADLIRFVENRHDLFQLDRNLHPTIQRVILKTTERSRRRRVQDLESVRNLLRNFRAGNRRMGAGAPENLVYGDKVSAILRALRDRLFDLSKRNKLIHHESTAQFVNLTAASFPRTLAYQNIDRQQLFIWQPDLEERFREGRTIPLDRYLSGEAKTKAFAALQQARAAAAKDEKEFGFSNLRLVLAFLHWHNLKDEAAKNQVIHSPLLLLPVSLEVVPGVAESFNLKPRGTEAEVNPALRYHLKTLYNLDLPERIDLAMTTPQEFATALAKMIEDSHAGMSLEIVAQPRIRVRCETVIYRPVNNELPNGLCGDLVSQFCGVDYSYRTNPMTPLGIRLFESYVRPVSLPLEYAHYEQENYDLILEAEANPCRWELDLCSMTLGNFDFQKMTLVKDYEELLARGGRHNAFDDLFSPGVRPAAEPLMGLPIGDQNLIASADPTQVSAIAQARMGRNMIIQGPPGTGKSQTITNLMADCVAQGKRVLFVCEKRAALDVVHARLDRAGLGELAVLIHDSQGDRGRFLRNLEESYHSVLVTGGAAPGESLTSEVVAAIEQKLKLIRTFEAELKGTMGGPGRSILEIYERLIELQPHASRLEPGLVDRLPGYETWNEHAPTIYLLAEALKAVGRRRTLRGTPLSELATSCFSGRMAAEGISRELRGREEPVRRLVDLMEELDRIFGSLSLGEMPPLVEVASHAHYFVTHDLMGMIRPESFESRRLRELDEEMAGLLAGRDRTREENRNWKEKLPPAEVGGALGISRYLDQAHWRFLHRRYWRLRGILRSRYDFKSHAVAPEWTRVLGSLEEEYRLGEQIEVLAGRIRREFLVSDSGRLLETTRRLRELQRRLPGTERMRELLQVLSSHRDSQRVVTGLYLAGQALEELKGLEQILPRYQDRTAKELRDIFTGVLRDLPLLPELAESFRGVLALPPEIGRTVRDLDLEPETMESAIMGKALQDQVGGKGGLNALDGSTFQRARDELSQLYGAWIQNKGRKLAGTARQAAWKAMQLPAGSRDHLPAAERERLRRVQSGKELLEQQFGLKQRFKSIREIATGSRAFLFDLKPVWLMSPLSVSQTLPMETDLFDVVIFDEASQIKLEDAIPSIFRGKQVIVVGDQMQLPPTNFFSANTLEEETVVRFRDGDGIGAIDLSADSLLTHAIPRLPDTLLGWHYRSRHEALISFSNQAFYEGKLLTVPDRQAVEELREPIVLRDPADTAEALRAAMERSISVHEVRGGEYEDRRNRKEARAIAGLVRDLLRRQRGVEGGERQTIGVVAFSDAQQQEIDRALEQLAREDLEFKGLLAAERERADGGEFTGLFVKNLENVQGDERDIIILSVCFAPGRDGSMKMNFGPINQAGGEKRLNVILSRARRHMMVVTSIKSDQITNVWNDGARCLRNFLEYADAVSTGDREGVERVLRRLQSAGRGPENEPGERSGASGGSVTAKALAEALAGRGYAVSMGNGDSGFKIDLAVRRPGSALYDLAILLDGQVRSAGADCLERAVLRPGMLKDYGWRVLDVLSKDWYENPNEVLAQIESALGGPGSLLQTGSLN